MYPIRACELDFNKVYAKGMERITGELCQQRKTEEETSARGGASGPFRFRFFFGHVIMHNIVCTCLFYYSCPLCGRLINCSL